jgi:hypothetical protein
MNSIPATIAKNHSTIKNKNILCVGFGAGFTAAGINLYWSDNNGAEIHYV